MIAIRLSPYVILVKVDPWLVVLLLKLVFPQSFFTDLHHMRILSCETRWSSAWLMFSDSGSSLQVPGIGSLVSDVDAIGEECGEFAVRVDELVDGIKGKRCSIIFGCSGRSLHRYFSFSLSLSDVIFAKRACP